MRREALGAGAALAPRDLAAWLPLLLAMARGARAACVRAVQLLALPALAFAQDQHAAIHSTRGVQHKPPLISDDMVVGGIMIMFLLLFAFGARARRCHVGTHRNLF